MKVLVIPDVHLKPWMLDRADALMQDNGVEHAVVLGDLVDDFNATIEDYVETIGRAREFDDAHANTRWCVGNHDFMYLRLEDRCRCSGFLEHGQWQIRHLIEGLREQTGDRMRVVHCVDNTLFSHAGVAASYVKVIREKLRDEALPLDDVLEFIEQASPQLLWEENSPLWLRPSYEDETVDGVFQVVGHTPIDMPSYSSGMLICDTFSGHRGLSLTRDQSFVVFDTVTGEWEMVS